MKVLDLFSGIGGFSLGLERAGMETVAFCEIEEYPRKVLAKHWPGVPIYEDVRDVTKQRLESDGITRIDVITGGFPCQDLSVGGKQEGIYAPRSGLWSECKRLIREVRPNYAVFENVTNLLAGDRGRWFQRVLWDISEIGYDAEWHCIPASYLGASHRRDRVCIIAYPNEIGCQRVTQESLEQFATESPESMRGFARYRKRSDLPASRFCRASDGVPGRVDRVAALGNAVVPQLSEMVGRAIMAQTNQDYSDKGEVR